MKKVYKNITHVLRLNRFIVLAVVVLCLLTSGLSMGLLYHYQEKLLNAAFAIDAEGTILPLQLVGQEEKREVEALAHIDLFHRLFYGLDDSNYRDHLDKEVDIELDLDKEPYRFRARAVFEVHRGAVMDRYQLVTSGELIVVERNFPHNPHGLLITDFFEDSLRQLEPENN